MTQYKKAVITVAALGALMAGTNSAAADTPKLSAGAAQSGGGTAGLCKRVPKIEKRITTVLKRVNGKADQRGSIAALEQRVAAAKADGPAQVATFLEGRLASRTSHLVTLKLRQKDLAAVKTWCEGNNGGKR